MSKKKDKADIWMPIYIGDYMAATSRLTTEQHGAYLLLLMDYWKNGPPPLNHQILAQITRMSMDAWSNACSIVLAFFEHRDGMLYHTRVEQEKASADDNKAKNKARATAAAEKRWAKDAPSNAPSIPQALPNECPSPSPSPSTNVDIKNIGAEAPVLLPESPELELPEVPEETPPIDNKPVRFEGKRALIAEGVSNELAGAFIKIRAAHRAPLSQFALDGIKREAGKAGLSLPDTILLCVERGWRGFNASWLEPSGGSAKRAASTGMRVNGLDHSSTSAAMAASMERHGIVVADNDDPIDF